MSDSASLASGSKRSNKSISSSSPRRKIPDSKKNILKTLVQLVSDKDLKPKGKVVTQSEFESFLSYRHSRPLGEDELRYCREYYGSSIPKQLHLVQYGSSAKRQKTFEERVFERAITINEAYGDLIEERVRRAGTAIDVDSALSTSEIDDSDIDSGSEGFSIISVVEPSCAYDPPIKCDPFLIEYHIRMPVSKRFLESIVSGKDTIFFCDIENIRFAVEKEDFERSLVLCAYTGTLDKGLVKTKKVMELLFSNRLYLLHTDAGKERADGLIDVFALDFHHRIPDKNVRFVIVSNDNGFKNAMTTVYSQGRQIIRIAVSGDHDGDAIYREALKHFQAARNNNNNEDNKEKNQLAQIEEHAPLDDQNTLEDPNQDALQDVEKSQVDPETSALHDQQQ